MAGMATEITISATVPKKVKVTLIGVEYKIAVPKTTAGIIVAQQIQAAGEDVDLLMDEVKEWVMDTFGDTQGEAVWKRLFDPKDELDIPHITQLIVKLVEVATNPTTSPSD
jgi:hypothetical protein